MDSYRGRYVSPTSRRGHQLIRATGPRIAKGLATHLLHEIDIYQAIELRDREVARPIVTDLDQDLPLLA